MKKVISILLMMIFLIFLAGVDCFAGEGSEGDTGGRLMVVLSGNFLSPADDGFRTIYSKGVVYPGLKAGYRISRGIYLWAGYGFFSLKSETPVLKLDTKSTQHFLSAGLGVMFHISPKLDYTGELGIFSGSYREESMGEVLKGSAPGLVLNNGLLIYLNRTFYVELSLGYLTASDTLEDVKIKLGGLRTGLGLGVRF